MYTSGTTGRPKGVISTHFNVVTNFTLASSQNPSLLQGDICLIAPPLFHAAAYVVAGGALLKGGILNIKKSFDVSEVIKSLIDEKVHHAILIPSMIAFLITVPNIETMKFSLKRIHYGGSSIPYEVLKKAMSIFKCDFAQGFGQTEGVATFTRLSPEDHINAVTSPDTMWRERLKSAGQMLLGFQVLIVDENNQSLTPRKIGEIIVKGPSVMKGYWKQPKASEETLRNGWLHTGDLGYLDEGGYVYIVDRIKDMIVTGGENVYPREIEEVLYQHPSIAEAAVFGIPHPLWVEEVVGAIVLREGKQATPTELIDFCRPKIARFKLPKRIFIVTQIPKKNTTGKILKRELRQQYANTNNTQSPTPKL